MLTATNLNVKMAYSQLMLKGGMLAFGKRGTEGQTVLVYMAFGLLAAALVVTGIVNKSLEDIKGETLEKNYIARDIALVLDAVYAVPGDLEYSYSERGYKYMVEFSEGRVFVRKNAVDRNVGVYGFFDGGLKGSDRLKAVFVPNRNIPEPMLIIFVKKGGVVSVTAKNNI